MGTLSGALRGQVKFHSEKCCGSPYNLLVISGVWTLNTWHASINAISTTETWLTRSLNRRRLLVPKALQATDTVGIGCHLFVNNILPVTQRCTLKVDECTFTGKHYFSLSSVFIVDLPLLSTDGTPITSQPSVRWNEQPKTLFMTTQRWRRYLLYQL